jgi:hypothetical protein
VENEGGVSVLGGAMIGSKIVFEKDRFAAALAGGALLLLFVLFYALSQNLAGLEREIEELRSLNSAVLELDARHAALDGKIAALDALPRRTTAMAMENQVNAMAHAVQDLDQRLDGRYRNKLGAIQALLTEIGKDLAEEK